MSENAFEKIFFELEREDEQWPPVDTESVRAIKIRGAEYELRNTPFFMRGVSWGDIISARPRHDRDDNLYFESVVQHRGHSTYRIFFQSADQSVFDTWWAKLAELGCEYEALNDQFYAIDMSPDVNVHAAYAILEQGVSGAVWDFEEGFYFNPERECSS